MLDNDALQDMLSSLGPFRLDTILRRGIITTSLKAYDLHAHHHYLFKLYHHRTPPDDAFAVIGATTDRNGHASGGWVVRRRRWFARCLRERLNQFPYMTTAERRFVYGQVCRLAGCRVKVSNVMLTPWNRVVIVDDQEYYDDDERTLLLDDTEPAVTMAELRDILELPLVEKDQFVEEYLESLAIFTTQSCFERAAFLTVEQVLETIEDVCDDSDLLSLLVMCLISIMKLSAFNGTRLKALSLIVKCVLKLDQFTLKWYVLPACMDILASTTDTVLLKVMSLRVIHHIHTRVEPIKKHRIKRLLKPDDFLLLGQFAILFGDVPLLRDFLTTNNTYVMSVDGGDEESIVEVVQAAADSGVMDQHLLQLACQVYDQMEIEWNILPYLNGDDIAFWAILLLNQKLSLHCILQQSNYVSGLGWLANKIMNIKIVPHPIDTMNNLQRETPSSPHPPDQPTDELLEVVDEERQQPPSDPFTRLRQSMRFWFPTRQTIRLADMEWFEGVVAVSVNDQFVCVICKRVVQWYRHDGFPMKRPVKQIAVVDGRELVDGVVCEDNSVIVLNSDNVVECLETKNKFVVEERVIKLAVSSDRLFIVTVSRLIALSRRPPLTTLYTIHLPAAITCADFSTKHAFMVAGTATGSLHLVDLRARLIAATTTPTPTTLKQICLHADWSARSEHKRPRVWMATSDGLHLVDAVNGARHRTIPGGTLAVGTTMGAHHVVFVGDDLGVEYYDYRMDRRQRFGTLAARPVKVEYLEGAVFVCCEDNQSVLLY